MEVILYKLKSSLFVKNVVETFFNKILLLVIGLITSIIIARFLGPEGRGILATATLFLGLGVQFGNIGLHSTNTHFAAKNKLNTPILFGNSLMAGSIFGVIIMGLFIFINNIFPSQNPINGYLLFWTVLTIPVLLINLLIQNIILGLNLIKEFNKVELLTKILATLILTTYILISKVITEYIQFSIFLSSLFSLLYNLHILLKISRPEFSFSFFTQNFSYGLKGYFAALLSFIQQRIIIYFITQNSVISESGYFSIAQTIVDLSLIFPITVASILFPKLSSSDSDFHKWVTAKKVIMVIGAFMFLYCVFLYFFSPYIINKLYGPLFSKSNEIIIYLLPSLFFLSIVSLIMNYYASIEMPLIVIVTPLISCIFIFILCFYTQHNFTAVKAAIINSISNFVAFVISSFYFFKKPNKTI